MIDPQTLVEEFPQETGLCYLNHAAVAPWPRRSAEAVRAFADENVVQGARNYPAWLQLEHKLRGQLRELTGAADESEIALVKNTSEALSFVAYGLDWQPGDNVVITDQEFPSNRIVWESLQSQGVTVHQATITGSDDPEAEIASCIDTRTRIVAVSSVQYGTGLRLDVERLGEICRQNKVLYCLDSIQSLGVVDFDVQAAQADFAMADGHKWMLGPEGLGVFYCRKEVMDQLSLYEYGWHMIEKQGDYDRKEWEIAESARRFECGSANMLGAHALSASLSLLLEAGMPQVESAVAERIGWLIDQLDSISSAQIITPRAATARAGIVTFRIDGQDPAALHRALMNAGVVCAMRGGGVRFSPHFYTPCSTLELAIQKLTALI